MEKMCMCTHERTNFECLSAIHLDFHEGSLTGQELAKQAALVGQQAAGTQAHHCIQLFFWGGGQCVLGPTLKFQKHFIDQLLPPSPQKNFLKNHKSLPYENFQEFPTYLENV